MKKLQEIDFSSWSLRLGLVFVFLYAGVSSLQDPLVWASFLPGFMTRIVTGTTLVKFFAVYELLLVAWLVSGKRLRWCALLCTVTLAGIVFANLSQLLVTFRDVGLACMALALFFAASMRTRQ
jgi:hypothetical protein